ncbi:MAG: MopE-related protein [Myxococcota bacterium]
MTGATRSKARSDRSHALKGALLSDDGCAQTIPTEDPEMPHLVGAVDLALSKKTSGTGSSQEQYQTHACAVLGTPEAESGPRGEVWCWGDNHVGQLGDGAPFEGSRTSAAPVIDPVSGEPFEGATSVSIAKTTTCATTANAGEVVCWGSDTYGLMANGEGVSELHPVAIDALTGSDLLTGGYLHACARQGGGVICWGQSAYGQTGQLSFDLVQTPSPIAGLNGVVALASGFNASCAATAQGVVCWGENKADIFAQGLYESPTSLKVTGLYEELFDCDDGVELCEGFDDDCDGEIDEGFEGLGESCTEGDGACMNEGIIVCDPGGESAICSVSAGEPSDELCDGLDNDCNGETDEGYDLGTTCTVGEGACAVEGTRLCADDGEGTLCSATPSGPMSESCNSVDDNCDGQTDEGELCPNSDPSVTTLCDGGQCVAQGCDAGTWDIDGLSENACEYACTVTGDGLSDATCDEVDDDCDGEVDEDALGCGLPSPVIQLVHNEDVTLSGFSWEYADAVYCALKAEGSVWCWGESSEHWIPAGGVTEQPPEGVPTEIALLKPITSVALSLSVAFALDADGSLWAWGGQRHGLLGDGVHSDDPYDISAPLALINPVDDAPFTDVVDVDVSEAHACMLHDDQTLSCWGRRAQALWAMASMTPRVTTGAPRHF